MKSGCREQHDTISNNMLIHELTKPASPEQARIRAMQAQVRQAQQRVKAERVRQQQARLNQQRSKLAGM